MYAGVGTLERQFKLVADKSDCVLFLLKLVWFMTITQAINHQHKFHSLCHRRAKCFEEFNSQV